MVFSYEKGLSRNIRYAFLSRCFLVCKAVSGYICTCDICRCVFMQPPVVVGTFPCVLYNNV